MAGKPRVVPAAVPPDVATPGPWRFEVRPDSHSVELLAPGGVVMSFERWGMGRATPLFRTAAPVRLERAESFGVLEVGREHHTWHRLLRHPDARLVESAPVLLAAAERALASHAAGCSCEACMVLRAAVLSAKRVR